MGSLIAFIFIETHNRRQGSKILLTWRGKGLQMCTIIVYIIDIKEHHRRFGLGGYFIAAVLAATRYSRRGFSPCLAIRARRVRVPGGSKFHLEAGTIHPCWNLTGT